MVSAAQHTIKNLDLVSHLGLHVDLLVDDRCIDSDLVRNKILNLHALDVLDCILAKGMTQKPWFCQVT